MIKLLMGFILLSTHCLAPQTSVDDVEFYLRYQVYCYKQTGMSHDEITCRLTEECRKQHIMISACVHCDEILGVSVGKVDLGVSHGLCPDCVKELYPEYPRVWRSESCCLLRLELQRKNAVLFSV